MPLRSALLVLVAVVGSGLLAACSRDEHGNTDMNKQSAVSIPPILPLRLLLAPDEFVAPQISPDGLWMSYIAPSEGAANLFVAPVADPRRGKPVTHYTQRGVQATDVSGVVMYRWTLDSRYVIYPQD